MVSPEQRSAAERLGNELLDLARIPACDALFELLARGIDTNGISGGYIVLPSFRFVACKAQLLERRFPRRPRPHPAADAASAGADCFRGIVLRDERVRKYPGPRREPFRKALCG